VTKARLRSVEQVAVALAATLGALALLGWVLHAPALKGLLPGGTAAMKANTALCFILTSVALWLASAEAGARKARRFASACSVLVLLVCGLTLVEYLSGWNLGLDEALVKDASSSAASYPGRMAPNTAAAFLLLSTALVLLLAKPHRRRLTGAALLGALTALLGLFAVAGYLGNVSIGYGWSNLTTMTLDAGAAFMLLGMACLTLAWRTAGLRLAIGGPLLAGFLLGLGVFVALGVVSYKSARGFADTAAWVRHTIEVLANLQEVRSDDVELELAVRGFAATAREEFRAPYQEALARLLDHERGLRRLTADNAVQQARLTALEDLIREQEAFSAQAVELGRQQDARAAAVLVSTGRGQQLASQIGALLAAMERMERDLLAKREADNRALTASTFSILPVGTFSGVSVLLAVLFFLNSEATERRRAEAAGRHAAAIVESTSDAVIAKTLQGIITSWNPGAERIFGYTAQQAVGQSVLMLIPPDRASEEATILSRIARGERVEHFETVRLRKDGRRMDVSVTVSPVKDDAGRVAGASKILRDVTERKAAADALQQLGTRLTTTLENMNAAFFTVDREWRFTYLNGECERLLHRTRGELLGKVLWDEFKDAIGGPSDQNYHVAMAENRAVAFEEFYPPLGMWLEVNAYPSPDGLAVYFRDVTERKQAAERLRESEERFSAAFRSSPVAIAINRRRDQISLEVNDSFLRLFECTREEVIGCTLPELGLLEQEEVTSLRQQLTAAGSLDNAEVAARTRQGRPLNISISVGVIQLGGEACSVSTVVDITERRQAERRIMQLNAELEQRVFERTEQLEAANKDLEAFSYSVSHDLRSPLRTVDGFSQALLEDFGPQLPKEAQRLIGTIRDGAQRMGALIDDLLAFSRLGRQSLKRPVAVDMGGLVKEVVQELSAEQHGRNVEVRVADLPPGHGDRALLRQVWVNLLSNALKYTRKRDVAVVEIGWASENGETVYSVADNGAGFDMKYGHKLFGVFQRLHGAEDFEGTGVGLAIVRRIVERHGGRVWAEAALNRGATFRFTLEKGPRA
jgi:PAS domain S-box-containing protein